MSAEPTFTSKAARPKERRLLHSQVVATHDDIGRGVPPMKRTMRVIMITVSAAALVFLAVRPADRGVTACRQLQRASGRADAASDRPSAPPSCGTWGTKWRLSWSLGPAPAGSSISAAAHARRAVSTDK